MQDGLQHLLRATELDPSLIGASVDLVNLCVAQGFYGFMSPTMAADIVRRAAESTPDLAIRAQAILPALGWIRFLCGPQSARRRSRPSRFPLICPTTRGLPALAPCSRSAAIALAKPSICSRAAIRLDPFSPRLQARLAWALHLAAGDGPMPVSTRSAPLSVSFPKMNPPTSSRPSSSPSTAKRLRPTKSRRQLAQRLPYFDLATEVHAYTLACAGRADEARTILERLQWLSRERFLLRAFTPAVYVALGEPDTALAELRISDKIRCPWFFQMLADPRLKPLECRPEFLQMRAILSGMEAEVKSRRSGIVKRPPNPATEIALSLAQSHGSSVTLPSQCGGNWISAKLSRRTRRRNSVERRTLLKTLSAAAAARRRCQPWSRTNSLRRSSRRRCRNHGRRWSACADSRRRPPRNAAAQDHRRQSHQDRPRRLQLDHRQS